VSDTRVITIDESWKIRNGRVYRLMRMQYSDGTWTPWLVERTAHKAVPFFFISEDLLDREIRPSVRTTAAPIHST
jgi:hypothetical protein